MNKDINSHRHHNYNQISKHNMIALLYESEAFQIYTCADRVYVMNCN